MASQGLGASNAEGEHERLLPLLPAEEDHTSDNGIPQAQQQPPQTVELPSSAPPQRQFSQRRRSSDLDIEASIAAYPVVRGVPIGEADGLLFLPDLPNAMQLWRCQSTMMLIWLVSSVLLLLLFAPFFISTGLFLGAEVACILGIMASSMHLCKKDAADGLELSTQIKLAATCGAAAFFLDCLTAVLDLLIVWSVNCEGDEACTSIMNCAVLFGICLSWHGYLSVAISGRARSLLPLLNPVSSGTVQL